MNAAGPRQAALEARLRRLLGGLDAAAGFEQRVMQRVAAQAAVPRVDLRAQFERRRKLLRRRLRREAWLNVTTIVGVGACAGALLWRYAPAIGRLAGNSTLQIDMGLLIGGTLAAVGIAVWFVVKRMDAASG